MGIPKTSGSSLAASQASNLEHLLWEFFAQFQSQHTRRSYQKDIQIYFEFLQQLLGLSPLDIRKKEALAYRESMTQSELAPKTINRRLSSVSGLYDFFVEKQLMEINPFKGIKRPRQEVARETNDLSDEQVLALLDYLEQDTKVSSLHRAVVVLLFTTGIRKQELTRLRVKDVDLDAEPPHINVKGKGGKHLVKPLPSYTAQALQSYKDSLKDKFTWKKDDVFFRPSKNPKNRFNLNKELDPKSVDYIFHRVCRAAGIFDRLSPHSARATYIGSALENGADLYNVSRDVGHSSVKTTEEYNKRRFRLRDSSIHHLGFLKKKK